jgi:hypothetical protein
LLLLAAYSNGSLNAKEVSGKQPIRDIIGEADGKPAGCIR